MNTLIIEDIPTKAEKICECLRDELGYQTIDIRGSYQSGLRAIMSGAYELCILDMTLPTYDVQSTETGYKHMAFAGKLIVREIKRKRVPVKVLVVTQYDSFAEQIEEKTLKQLDDELRHDYPGVFLGSVFYSDQSADWREEIKDILSKHTPL